MDGGPARRHLPGDARAHDGADGHPRHGLRRVARHRARREERPRRLHERRVSGQWRPDVHDAVREDLPGELTGGAPLRAAVQEANATPGADTIVVPAGTYRLTLPGSGGGAGPTGRPAPLDTVA